MAGIGKGRLFADGQLASTKTTIYTVPTASVAYLRFVSMHNTAGTGTTVTVYVTRPGHSSRIIYKASLASDTTYYPMQGETIILEGGCTLDGLASAANVVDYVICGIEET